MSHWSDTYLGWEYEVGSRDCAVLVVSIQKEVFNKEIVLPRDYRANTVWSAAAMFSKVFDTIAERVESPEDGDIVLMNIGNKSSHVGCLCKIDGIDFVIHAVQSFGCAIRTQITRLPQLGMSVEGYYRCKQM